MVTLHGAVVSGCPLRINVLSAAADASRCVLRGAGLSHAASRVPASFEIEFLDSLGEVTHAEELDVFLQPFSNPPTAREGSAMATEAAGADGEEQVQRKGDEPSAATSTSIEDLQTFPCAWFVGGDKPLIVRTACGLDSQQIGMLAPGSKITCVSGTRIDEGTFRSACLAPITAACRLAHKCRNDTLSSGSMLTYSCISIDGCSVLTPRAASDCAVSFLLEGFKRDRDGSTMLRSPARQPDHANSTIMDNATDSVADGSDGTTGLSPAMMMMFAGEQRKPADASGSPAEDVTVEEGKGSLVGESDHDTTRLPGVGWVTAVKDGRPNLAQVRYARLDAAERQQHIVLWQRRQQADKAAALAAGKANAAAAKDGKVTHVAVQPMPEVLQGIGFAYGGVDPGVLHAHGKLIRQHTVRYSVGLSGQYWMHVGLRHQEKALSGSPFRLTVLPGAAAATSTRLPPEAMPLHGAVGSVEDQTAGCAFVLQVCDVMGNQCQAGGTKLEIVNTSGGIEEWVAEDKHHFCEYED